MAENQTTGQRHLTPEERAVFAESFRNSVKIIDDWRSPAEPAGGQCIAIDENGEECAAFYSDGRWYLCTNLKHPDNEFHPQAWMPLPRRERGWLAERLARAHAEVMSWSPWKREAMRREACRGR